MDELLEEFIAETRDTLKAIEGALIDWERDPSDRGTLDGIFRFVHTVKGSCGFLDLPRLTRLSHAAEDILSAVRDGEITATTDLVSCVLTIIDRISDVTEALENGTSVVDDDHLLIDQLATLRAGKQVLPEVILADVTLAEVTQQPARERRDAARPVSRNRSVRLSLDLLDELMSGVSDMVLARNEMARRLRDSEPSVELDQLFSRLSGSIAEMRDRIGLVRLQPIERLFVSFPRMVRDVAQDLGKDITLEIMGGDVEIDREMVELVRDPLTHILRNAIDHGIENAVTRVASGKPASATIRLSAQQAGNQIVIEVSDDGCGIDVGKLVGRAIARGIIGADEAAQMSPRDKLELIFEPGLSTADVVTDVSGRGVGMDIVRHRIEETGGTIELRNAPGRGLTVLLRLPLTLSIMPGLSIQSGGMLFAIPRSAVVEILSMRGGQVRIDTAGGAEIAAIRGTRMAFVSLGRVLGHAAEEEPQTVIVVRPAAGRRYALGVAAVIDHEELVVKPAPPLLMASGLYAGLSLPDSGRPIMLLDAAGIANIAGVSDQFEEVRVVSAEGQPSGEGRALLFQCLTGVRKAIRLSVLDRMQEVPASAIQHLGGAWRMSCDGHHGVVLCLTAAPAGESAKLLRLIDGTQTIYIAVEDMLDIIDLHDIVHAVGGGACEGVIDHDGEQIELIDAHGFFAQAAALGPALAVRDAPLCYLEKDDGGWMANVLRPLLEAAGYRVTQDPADRAAAAAELIASGSITTDGQIPAATGRVLYLHEAPGRHGDDTVYRYDRAGLLAALEWRVAQNSPSANKDAA